MARVNVVYNLDPKGMESDQNETVEVSETIFHTTDRDKKGVKELAREKLQKQLGVEIPWIVKVELL